MSGEDDPSLNDRILSASPNLEFYITPFCKAFIKHCFTYEAKKRPTIDDLMASPWVEHHLAKSSQQEKSSKFLF